MEETEVIVEEMKLTNNKLDKNNKKLVKIDKRIQRILKMLWENKLLILQINCQENEKLKKMKIQWQI